MKPTQLLAISSLCGAMAACLAWPPIIAADEAPVTVYAWATHDGKNIVYHYEIVNLLDEGINEFWIGYMHRNARGFTESEVQRDEYNNVIPEIRVRPVGARGLLDSPPRAHSVEWELPPTSTTQPEGWQPGLGSVQELPGHWFEWDTDVDAAVIGPRKVLGGFSVTLSERDDDGYLRGHFTIPLKIYTGRLTIKDTLPPELILRVSPASVSKLSGTSLKVQAILTVTDDYDPKPEIKLESITASVPMNQSEIKAAVFGTDDRLFMLPVKKDPTGKPVVFTVTYSATDGTGNKATASATVTLNP